MSATVGRNIVNDETLARWREAQPHQRAQVLRFLGNSAKDMDKQELHSLAGLARDAVMLLGDLGARAAAEPEAPRRSWQCSGCRFVFPGPWQKVCPSCGLTDFWTGSVDPKAPAWPGKAAEPEAKASWIARCQRCPNAVLNAGDTCDACEGSKAEANDEWSSLPIELNVDEAKRFAAMLNDLGSALRSMLNAAEPAAKAHCADVPVGLGCPKCDGTGSDCSTFPIAGCSMCMGSGSRCSNCGRGTK